MLTLAALIALAAAPALPVAVPGSGPVTVYQDNRGLSCGSRIADGARVQNRIAASATKKRLLAAGYAPVKIVVIEDGDRVTGEQTGGAVVVQGTSPRTRC